MEGPWGTPRSRTKIRWDRISANPACTELGAQGGSRRASCLPGLQGAGSGQPDHTLEGAGKGYRGGGCEGHSQGQLLARWPQFLAGGSWKLLNFHGACRKWSVIETEKEHGTSRAGGREEELTNLCGEQGPLPAWCDGANDTDQAPAVRQTRAPFWNWHSPMQWLSGRLP